MLTYPATLPCVSRIDGPSATASAGAVRTLMEAGNTRQRRRHRTLPHRLALSFDIAQSELSAWITWCNANAWADFFLLNLPGIIASRAGVDSAPVPVRFISDITRELWQGRGLWGWRAHVEVEYQPSAADLASVPIGDWIIANLATQAQTWPAPSRVFDFSRTPLDAAIAFTRASTATYIDAAGLVHAAAVNEARIECDPITHAPRGLLCEAAVANACLQSQTMLTATWSKQLGTCAAVGGAAPDGTATCTAFAEDATSGGHYLGQSIAAVTAARAYTLSAFVKAGAGAKRFPQLILTAAAFGATMLGCFDLVAGTSVTSGGCTADMVAFGGGWWRISITATSTSAVASSLQFRSSNALTSAPAAYVGDGVSALQWWGAQLELNAMATSYIPTTTVAVTRAVDVAAVTGADFSSWWRQAEGTVVVVGRSFDAASGLSSRLWQAQGPTTADALLAYRASVDSTAHFDVAASSVNQATLNAGPMALKTQVRLVAAYRANDFAAQADGGAVVKDTAGIVPAVDRLNIGSRVAGSVALNGTVASFTYYPTRVPLEGDIGAPSDWIIAGTPAAPSTNRVLAGTPGAPSAWA
ncbi:MAG: hypothetical protein ACJ72W_01475 [Actinoallomurus sp.]|jgi:hypothetical protein